jgi:tetratricopeptide (TPR) repeat protein
LFVVAQRAFEDGFYDVSIRYVTQLLSEFPSTTKYVEAKLLEGQSYFFKKEYVKAFAVFKDLVTRGEYKDASLFWLGETYLKGGDLIKAQEQYQQVIDGFPTSLYRSQAYYSLAWSYFQKGDYPQAKKIFQELVEKYPSNNLTEDATFKMGECDYNAGQYEGAVFLFNKYIQDHPQSSRLYEAQFNVAESFYYLEQYDKSVEAYLKAKSLTKDPHSITSSMIGVGWSYMKMQKFDEALKAFDDAQSSAKASNIPEDDILLGKASLFTSQEKFKEATASYTDLITRFPDSARIPESYLGRANAFYLANDFASAINDYKQILSLYEASPDQTKLIEKARFGLAWTYLKSGDLDNSIKSFQTVVDKTDNKTVKVSALTQIADAYQEAGQAEKAVDVYDKILKEMPDTPYSDHVQYRLGIALLKLGRLDPAILALQALRTNYPKSKFLEESQYYLGAAYFKKKDWSASIEVLSSFIKSALPQGEFSSEATYLMALAHFNLRQFDKAINVFNEMIKAYPDQPLILQNAQTGLAKTYYEMGDTKEGLARFKEIVYRYPKTDAALESLLWMGQHSMATRGFERAVECYSQALNDMPQTDKKGLIHFELAMAYHALEQFDKALEHYRQVDEKNDPSLYPKAKLAIAEIFAKELDPAKAIDTYKSIIATSPDFKRDAFVKIAQIYRKQREYKNELEAYQQALEVPKSQSDTSNAQIQFAIGDVYEILGELDKAAEVYFKIPYVYSKDPSWVIKAYLRIGKIYENKEDWDKAISSYKKIIEMNVAESKFANERITWIQDRRNRK